MSDNNDDFFAELDAEIKVHMDKSKLRANAAEARKKSQNRWVPREDREKAEAEYLLLRAMIEADMWRAVNTVALFTEQQCDGCGSVHRVFLQYMEYQVQKNKASNKRWVRVAAPDASLPRETLIQPHTTHFCADCCEEHGFAISSAIRMEPTESAWAVSPTYLQGDINASPEAN